MESLTSHRQGKNITSSWKNSVAGYSLAVSALLSGCVMTPAPSRGTSESYSVEMRDGTTVIQTNSTVPFRYKKIIGGVTYICEGFTAGSQRGNEPPRIKQREVCRPKRY